MDISPEEHNRRAYMAAFGTDYPTDRKALEYAAMLMPDLAPFKFKKQGGRHFLFSSKGEMSNGPDNFSCVVNSHLQYARNSQKRDRQT